MSYSHNQRKKNIKRFKKDPTNANPKFTKRDGQWKVVPETLDTPKPNGNRYGIEISTFDVVMGENNV